MKLPGRHPDDRELASLAVPAFLTYLAVPIYELTDTAIVGRLGVEQLAGLAAAVAAFSTVFFILSSVSNGLSGSIARRRGSGSERGALEMWVSGSWFVGIVGSAGALGLAIFARPLMHALGADGAAANYAVTYLRISTIGLPVLMLAGAATHFLRAGRGNARVPLAVTVTASVMNLLLEVLFVWAWKWGVAGSAWSTVLVEWFAFATLLGFVLRGTGHLRLSFLPCRSGLREVSRVGSWMVVRTTALTAALMLLTASAARISTNALAANQIAYQVWLSLAIGVAGLETAVNALVGKHVGANDPETARRVARRSLEYGLAIGVVSLVVVAVAREPLAALFTADPAVRALAASALLVVAAMQPIAAVSYTFDGLYVGSGDVRFLAFQATTAFVVVMLPGALLVVANGWDLNALWFVMGAWVAWRCGLGWLRFVHGRWVAVTAVPQPVLS